MDSLSPPRKISVIGLGKLGAPFAVCLAVKGYDVTAVDIDPEKVSRVNNGQAPVFEPGLENLLPRARARLRATLEYDEAIADSEVTFILVPTPSDARGMFSLEHVLEACARIGELLRYKNEFHTVVVTSTVLPGAMDNRIKPALEKSSGKRCGEKFALCYSPEFVALGSVIRDLLHPDFLLIGESEPRGGNAVLSVYRTLCENDPPVVRLNFINAEIAKLAVNTFVTTKIAFANLLARICERLPGADVDAVTSALSLDSRIGGKYLRGAIGYGGPCFPRDNLALAALARKLGVGATVAEATDRANREEVTALARLVKSRLVESGTVGIMGMAYKAGTDVVEQSQGLLLAQSLLAGGIKVVIYDPVASANAVKLLDRPISVAPAAEQCVAAADVVVLTTPWPEFRSLAPEIFTNNGRKKVLIDCWRLLDPTAFGRAAEYLPLGIGQGPGQRTRT
ncbi:MAG TPA: nucleotide sugar dehydrogenase [Candidatus Acidoferrales bacterium]|nr:nucleotide sugar dehydrogenase [Candidatus Acidoferrales bacterium]